MTSELPIVNATNARQQLVGPLDILERGVMAQPFVDPCARGVINAEPCPRELGRELPSRRRRIVLITCVIASSMAFIDGSVLTVALPKLRAALDTDLATVQWVITSYVLALAALTLIGGALADTYGKARILLIGCFLFGAASAGCALSGSIGWLIAVRVLQGIAAALLTPASLALIGATFPKAERTAAIGVWAAASSLTSAAGPVLGGLLTERFGWQAVFWINPPLAAIAMVLLFEFAPADLREVRRFDVVGAVIIACGLGALTWALSQIGRAETPVAASFASDTTLIVLFILGLGGIGGYAIWERVTDHPMTPPRLSMNRDFVGLNVATLLIYRDSRSCFSCCRSTSSTTGDCRPHLLDWRFCPSRSRLACYHHILVVWLTSSAPGPCSLLGLLERLSLMFG
jgi:MFS family permease